MLEDPLRRLKYFRGTLDSRDAILLESMRTNSHREIGLPGARPVMRIFDEILAEFPDLIQKFEYNAAPGTVRSQIAAARHKIHDRTAAMEQDAAEETRRG